MRVFLGVLAGAMATVVLARDALVFLNAWEIMALAIFFLVVARDEDPEARAAGWVYFVAAHVGTLALFALLRSRTESFELTHLPASSLGPGSSAAVLVLLGFGLKAGSVPLHVWLPGAHASAPSPVSAVLSGVLLKLGVYGMLRILWMVPSVPRWWAGVLFGVGALTCLFGISLAAAQADYKRLLAYSSIENIGVIVLGLGLLSLGLAQGEPVLAALGLTAAILHVWNHALFKPLLFLVAGSLLHATHTRRMSRLGGLARRMPRVAVLSVAGCVAICALPPMSGFVAEWLLYSGLARGLAGQAGAWGIGLAAAALALALTGTLALVTFVKFFATVFLGQERSEATNRACDSHWTMLVPMAGLALACLAIGSASAPVARLGLRTATLWSGMSPAPSLAAFGGLVRIGLFSAGVLLCAACGALWLGRRARRAERQGTWDCGFAAPTARMQYGDSALSQMLVALCSWLIVPERDPARVDGPFPAPASQRNGTPDLVLERGVLPFFRGAERAALHLRLLQKGRIQVYVLYIVLALLVLFLVR